MAFNGLFAPIRVEVPADPLTAKDRAKRPYTPPDWTDAETQPTRLRSEPDTDAVAPHVFKRGESER